MPTRLRVILPNMPHHVVQRGHNRGAVFIKERDCHYYPDNLAEWKTALGLKVFSCYCLTTNYIHLIVEANSSPMTSPN